MRGIENANPETLYGIFGDAQWTGKNRLPDALLRDLIEHFSRVRLGLGPNLFYNSPMEASVVVCRTAKPKARKGRILFINAVSEVTRERAQSFLTDGHIERIERIVKVYERFADEPGFARVATLEHVRAKDGNLSIPLYESAQANKARQDRAEYRAEALLAALEAWLESAARARASLGALLDSEKR
jgi:type I restriction enzyme M protein